jgi:hypothetical protein
VGPLLAFDAASGEVACMLLVLMAIADMHAL